MSSAWYMDDDVTVDQREEHHKSPKQFLEIGQLKEKTGVLVFKVSSMA